jgi:hypothetical protein
MLGSVFSVRSSVPQAPPDRPRLAGPDPEQAGFGARFVIASSFGSVLLAAIMAVAALVLLAVTVADRKLARQVRA